MKYYEKQHVRVEHARVVVPSPDVPPKEGEHVSAYILVVIVIMAGVMSLMA